MFDDIIEAVEAYIDDAAAAGSTDDLNKLSLVLRDAHSATAYRMSAVSLRLAGHVDGAMKDEATSERWLAAARKH